MKAEGASLLDFVGAPVLVGDPDGRVVYANPAFEQSFRIAPGAASGQELASLFAGGAREAVLAAVVAICNGAEQVRFKLREEHRDYLGMASPIAAEKDAVGVVLLLTDEPEQDPRLRVFQNEVKEPLDEAVVCLEHLREHASGRGGELPGELVERATAALERAHRWSDEVLAVLNGEHSTRMGSVDPVRVLRDAARRVQVDFERAGVRLDRLFPNQLPQAHGEETLLETALVRTLRHRLAHASAGQSIALSARPIGRGQDAALLVSVSSPCLENHAAPLPSSVDDTVAILGGRLQTVVEPRAGIATGLRLKLAG